MHFCTAPTLARKGSETKNTRLAPRALTASGRRAMLPWPTMMFWGTVKVKDFTENKTPFLHASGALRLRLVVLCLCKGCQPNASTASRRMATALSQSVSVMMSGGIMRMTLRPMAVTSRCLSMHLCLISTEVAKPSNSTPTSRP